MASRLNDLIMACICGIVLTSCAHGPCKALGALFGCSCTPQRPPPETEDATILPPDFDGRMQVDADLDGYTLQAIRIAADDLLNPDSSVDSCRAKQTSHKYQALRKGDVIFVRIDFKPENCGRKFGMLDSGATYAVSVDGRILRRFIDGMVSNQPRPAPPSPSAPDHQAEDKTPGKPAAQGASLPEQESPGVDTRSPQL